MPSKVPPRPDHGQSTTSEVWNAFSVDVEDYFQVGAFEGSISRSSWDDFEPRVEANTLGLADLFDRFEVRATFFFLGWVAERWPGLVKEVSSRGHEIGVHSFDHRRVTDQLPEEFRRDVRRTKAGLEDMISEEVIGFRAPNYSIVDETLWALDILLEEGFRYDSSIFPISHHDHYGIPDSPRFPHVIRANLESELVEFPISTVRVAGLNFPFVGGGYLRQFPFWLARWGMQRLNQKEKQSAVVYIHPWEIDSGQPRVQAPLFSRLRHYRNIGTTKSRLEALFREFRFTTIRTLLKL